MAVADRRPPGVRDAVARMPLQSWQGTVWRCHSRRYHGTDAAGSARTTGRFHKGPDKHPADSTWIALYTSAREHTALAERVRHTTPVLLSHLADQRITQIAVRLQRVVDICDDESCLACTGLGLMLAEICDPVDYAVPHAIAQAARERGAEGLFVPSCTRLDGGNLIVFTDRLLPGSSLDVVRSVDPDLYVDWSVYADEKRGPSSDD